MKVTATATRADGWWAVTVPEVEGAFTQARRLDQVAAMVRDAVGLLTGQPEDSIEVEVVPVTSADDNLVELSRVRQVAADAAAEANAKTRAAVAELVAMGYTVRDVAALLGVSPQRISQLAAIATGKKGKEKERTTVRKSAAFAPREAAAKRSSSRGRTVAASALSSPSRKSGRQAASKTLRGGSAAAKSKTIKDGSAEGAARRKPRA